MSKPPAPTHPSRPGLFLRRLSLKSLAQLLEFAVQMCPLLPPARNRAASGIQWTSRCQTIANPICELNHPIQDIKHSKHVESVALQTFGSRMQWATTNLRNNLLDRTCSCTIFNVSLSRTGTSPEQLWTELVSRCLKRTFPKTRSKFSFFPGWRHLKTIVPTVHVPPIPLIIHSRHGRNSTCVRLELIWSRCGLHSSSGRSHPNKMTISQWSWVCWEKLHPKPGFFHPIVGDCKKKGISTSHLTWSDCCFLLLFGRP